jgi:Dolichyl-phosphate-mannose-protein mannosyltransferase
MGMPIRPNLRVPLALAGAVVAVLLPAGAVVDRYLPAEYATRGPQLYQGIWLFKITLGLNAALWLAWPWAARSLDASRRPGAMSGPVATRTPLGRGEWVFLGLLTALAAILRLRGLDYSLTYDEIYFAQSMVRKTPAHIYALGSPILNQFTNWLAWVTTHALGFSERSMRLPTLIFGVAMIPATYLFARRWLDRAVATGATVLLTVSTQAVQYSDEAKGYSATAVFALVATWSFLEARRRGLRRDWVAYGLCAFFLGFAHVLSLVVVAAHFLIALVLPERKRMMPALIATMAYVGGALALMYSVSIAVTLRIAGDLSERHYTTLELADNLIRDFGAPLAAPAWSYALALLVAIGVRRLWTIDRVLAAAFVIPVALGLILNTTVLECMYMRYYTYSLPSYMILAALGGLDAASMLGRLAGRVGLGATGARRIATALPPALMALWIWPSALSLQGYYARERYPFKAVARRIEALPPGSRVVAGGYGEDKFRFYAPKIVGIPEMERLVAFIERERPDYVVTYLPVVYQHRVSSLGRDPLAGYELVHRETCHREEDGHEQDAFIWRIAPNSADPPTGGAKGTGS